MGLALVIIKQNGDTVRRVQVRTHPLGRGYIYARAAIMEPDHSLFVYASYFADVAGTDTTVLLLRIDTLGVVRWRRAYRPANASVIGYSCLLRTGDGYLLSTNRNAFPNSGAFIFFTPNVTKLDFAGNVVWERSMGTRGYGQVGEVRDVVACPDGSYLALGNTDDGTPYVPGASAQGRFDYYAVRFTSAGDTLRTHRFGAPGETEDGDCLRLMPAGGVAVTGLRYRYGAWVRPILDGQVYLLDSLLRPRWHMTTAFPLPYEVDWRYTVLQPLASGELVCGGSDHAPRPGAANPTYGTPVNSWASLKAYTPAGAVAWAWRHQYQGWDIGLGALVPNADGSAFVSGGAATGAIGMGYNTTYRAYAAYLHNVGAPYVPDLCARPPAAYFAAAATPATVQVLESSMPGPRYGVLVAWRWEWGDGTTSTGRAPGPHAYAAPPGPGTAVRLTVTNNLGCTSSYVEYPWGGRPTAAAAGQALAQRLAVFPNPATGAVAVALGGLGPQGPAALALLDGLGRVVRRAAAPVAGGRLAAALDVAGLPAGLYLLRVTTREGTATRRLTKE